MRFLRTAVIALGATQAAALSSKDIVIAIDGITEISAKTTEVAKDIDLSNLFQSIPVCIRVEDLHSLNLTLKPTGTHWRFQRHCCPCASDNSESEH